MINFCVRACHFGNTNNEQWVITNVSTGFYDIDIEPAFFRWGYAWPLHNVVEASRQILFGLHSRIGLDFGVLFAWAAVNTAIVSFVDLFAHGPFRLFTDSDCSSPSPVGSLCTSASMRYTSTGLDRRTGLAIHLSENIHPLLFMTNAYICLSERLLQ